MASLPAEGGSEAGERQRKNFQAEIRSRREFSVVGILRVAPSGTERARGKVGEVRMARQETRVGVGARSQRTSKIQ